MEILESFSHKSMTWHWRNTAEVDVRTVIVSSAIALQRKFPTDSSLTMNFMKRGNLSVMPSQVENHRFIHTESLIRVSSSLPSGVVAWRMRKTSPRFQLLRRRLPSVCLFKLLIIILRHSATIHNKSDCDKLSRKERKWASGASLSKSIEINPLNQRLNGRRNKLSVVTKNHVKSFWW